MKNLKITSCAVFSAEELIANAQCFCLDCDRGVVWISTKNELCSIENNKLSSVAPLSSHVTSCEDHVIGMEYLTDAECVCLALSGGSILTCDVATGQLECVGEIEVGVSCMAWSPEQDLVVMVTKEDNLVLMTKDFDPLAEKTLHQKDFGEAQFINVGWGKKATQFHGSEGKPKPEQLQEKVSKPAVAWDDRRVRISWRGDGDFFACSCIDPDSGSRVVRIWTRDCTHHSTSETILGLEQTLSWKPSGSLIACTQLKPHRSDVIFLERNGLQHGEFTFQIPPTDAHIRELLWNADSTVLCALCRCREVGEEWLQLWTVMNYHWYLKQEIRLAQSSSGGRPNFVGLLWDPVVPLKLHLLTERGQYISYTWKWTISESKSLSALNCSGVAVIDGSRVLYTPFRHSVIPPPMSGTQLQMPAQVSELAFSPLPNCNDFLAVLSDFRVAMFSVAKTAASADSGGVVPRPEPKLVGIGSIATSDSSFHCLRQFVWWREDRLLGVGVAEEDGRGVCREVVMQFSLDIDTDKNIIQIAKCSTVPCPGPVLCLYGNPNTGTAIVQLTSGEVMKLNAEGSGLSPWLLDSGSPLKYDELVRCEKMELALFNGKERVIGHCESRCLLYIDDLKVISGCTSFAVHDEFLLLTTNAHILHLMPLNSDPKVITPVTVETIQAEDKSVRRVERGSRIVTVVPADTRLVLQMPRGNLETVCPRVLVLSQVRRDLDRLQFGAAFRSMRTHRLNLNLVYDHNPKAFMDNVPRFIEELGSVDYINVFLTELSNDDVTKTLYPRTLLAGHPDKELGEKDASVAPVEYKMDRVCRAVREVLVGLGENHYFLSIITSYVKMSRPDLETVLTMIMKLKESQQKQPPALGVKGPNGVVTAARALKYTAYFVDINELYDIALGMYNLPLVIMVAEKSQKDPKEYLPFLNQLNRLPLDYRCYKIDAHLKRYKKALRYISKCGADKFEECFAFIREHALYQEALDIYTDRSSSEYKDIAKAYGNHLMEKTKYKASGIIFYQCCCYEEAFAAFEKAGCWEMAFVCSAKLQHSTADTIEAARRIATSLKSNRRFSEASRVFLDYAGDVEEAVVALLEGSLWAESLRLLHLHKRCDLVETHLLPALVEAHESRLSLFQELSSNFTRHSERLVVVREEKKLKQAAILEGTYAVDEKDADLFSDTSSVTGQSAISSQSSQLSKSSRRSSKSRRKGERKRLKLREGSVHEEEALLEALREIVSTVDSLQDDVSHLLPPLVQFGFTTEARAVQESFGGLLGSVQSNMSAIWGDGGGAVSAPIGLADIQRSLGPQATVNSIIAAMAAAKDSAPPINIGGPAPTLRETLHWKLDLLST